MTEIGLVEIVVSRDSDGSFEPTIVKRRYRQLYGIDGMVLPLSARCTWST